MSLALLLPILTLALLIWVVLIFILLRQNLALKRRVSHLGQEIEIQASRLNYQKAQYFDSENYFYSAMVIIMEMLMEIYLALKSEEGDLADKILMIIFNKAKGLFNPEKCILVKIDLEKNSFSRLHSSGYKDEELRSLNLTLDANNSFLGWSVQTGKFLSYEEAQQDALLSHLIESDPLKCHYAQPLKMNNRVKAVLCVGLLKRPIESEMAIRMFSLLSDIATVALSNAALTQKLRELSVRDSLSGLYNHSYFQKWLELALFELKGKGEVLSLAMVDLDYFKKINDAYGHQTGDIILKSISEALSSLQSNDCLCARYGGEEFVLAFRGKDAQQTYSIMEDIRQKISQQVFELQAKRINITISVGIAEAQLAKNKKLSKTELIASADQAIYKAKAEGRNRISIASP